MDESAWQPVDYSDSQPVFYSFPISGSVTELGMVDTEVMRRCVSIQTRSWRALSLANVWPVLPTPSLSCGYFLEDGQRRAVNYTVGPCGRDWILTGHCRTPRINFTKEKIELADDIDALLARVEDRLPHTKLEAALQIFELVGLPETIESYGSVRYELSFLSAVTAMEQLLVLPPDKRSMEMSITRSFGEAISALLVSEFDQLTSLSERFRAIYKLRSRLIHGAIMLDMADSSHSHLVSLTFQALALAIRNCLVLVERGVPPDDLSTLLAEAARSRESFEQFLAVILRESET